MPHPAPSAEFQLELLAKLERILSQGQFTTTYKFALLVALTNIAVEQGDDTGEALLHHERPHLRHERRAVHPIPTIHHPTRQQK